MSWPTAVCGPCDTIISLPSTSWSAKTSSIARFSRSHVSGSPSTSSPAPFGSRARQELARRVERRLARLLRAADAARSRPRSSSGGGCRRGPGRRRARSRCARRWSAMRRPGSPAAPPPARSRARGRRAARAPASISPALQPLRRTARPSRAARAARSRGRVSSRTRGISSEWMTTAPGGRPSPRRGTRRGCGTGTSWRSSGERIVSP